MNHLIVIVQLLGALDQGPASYPQVDKQNEELVKIMTAPIKAKTLAETHPELFEDSAK